MSAIAGVIWFDGAPAQPEWTPALLEFMRSRGPDERRCWIGASVALGHGMLRTTPEALHERQPLISEDARLVMVWDGRLDNREELRRALTAGGARLRDETDAELALQACVLWGDAAPSRLLGDFAFALWDVTRQELLCARDHIGARPFFYVHTSRFLAFASDEDPLIRLPGVSRDPNEERMAYYWEPRFTSFDHACAWTRDVRVLRPATVMVVRPDGALRSSQYWRLGTADEYRFSSDDEYREAFEAVFGEAVRCRLRASGSVAAMMSGGLDSAAIAGAMAGTAGSAAPDWHTYSVVADNPESCIETQCIYDLTRGLAERAHVLTVPAFAGVVTGSELVEAAWSKSHPIDNSILLPAMMCLAAHRNCHRVLLHGVTGDITLRVPTWYVAHYLKRREWRKAWREAHAVPGRHTLLSGTMPAELLGRGMWTAFAPRSLRWLRSRVASAPISTFKGGLISASFAEKLGLAFRLRQQRHAAKHALQSLQKDRIDAMGPPHGLELGVSIYDKVGGRFSIELRDPWADRRVVEFFLRLPLEQLVRDGWTKYLVRNAFQKPLTMRVRQRTGKEHLGWHFIQEVVDRSPEQVAEVVRGGLAPLAPYVNLEAVHAVYKRFLAFGSDADRESIFDLVTAVLWLQRLRG